MTRPVALGPTTLRRCGLAAVVVALASIPLAPLNALARMQTDSGRSDLTNELARVVGRTGAADARPNAAQLRQP